MKPVPITVAQKGSYNVTKSFIRFNLPMQFLTRAHGGFSRVECLEHTAKNVDTKLCIDNYMSSKTKSFIGDKRNDTNL